MRVKHKVAQTMRGKRNSRRWEWGEIRRTIPLHNRDGLLVREIILLPPSPRLAFFYVFVFYSFIYLCIGKAPVSDNARGGKHAVAVDNMGMMPDNQIGARLVQLFGQLFALGPNVRKVLGAPAQLVSKL